MKYYKCIFVGPQYGSCFITLLVFYNNNIFINCNWVVTQWQ